LCFHSRGVFSVQQGECMTFWALRAKLKASGGFRWKKVYKKKMKD